MVVFPMTVGLESKMVHLDTSRRALVQASYVIELQIEFLLHTI